VQQPEKEKKAKEAKGKAMPTGKKPKGDPRINVR